MAIRDLLWACPACLTRDSLVASGRGVLCTACGARLRRGARATIVLEVPGQPPRTRAARDWADVIGEPRDGDAAPGTRVLLRDAERARPLRVGGELLGFVERFGPRIAGTLSMDRDAITFQPDASTDSRVWPLLDITAVQPASSKLQLKVRARTVVTLQFLDSSVRLWEARIQHRIRTAWRQAGRGNIVEFQPRVTAR